MNKALPDSLTLLYHDISPNDGPSSTLSPEECRAAIPENTFKRHIDAIERKGRNILAPRFYLRRVTEPIPEGGDILLTFDGAYASHYDVVFPILRERGIRAIFCAPTSLIGEPGRLTWDHIRDMVTHGMLVGAHGHTHIPFTALDISHQRLEFELTGSLISQHVEMQPRVFAFPGGRCFRGTPAIAAEYGYEYVFLGAPLPPSNREGAWTLGRLPVQGDWDADDLANTLDNQDMYLAAMRRSYRWRLAAESALGNRLYTRAAKWLCRLRRR